MNKQDYIMTRLIAVFLISLVLPFAASAQKTPCLGAEYGGISHCEGTRFVCNNGKYSGSRSVCPGSVYGYEKKHTSGAEAVEVLNKNKKAQKKIADNAIKTVKEKNLIKDLKYAEIVKKTEITQSGNLLKLDYRGFTVWLDCEKRGLVKFQYNVQHDAANGPISRNLKLDPSVPRECQQISTSTYGKGYEPGYQVPISHLDYSPEAIEQSNYMINILPQTTQMRKGAWSQTEKITECYGNIDKLSVMGGVIWGDNSSDDYFVQSHGVKTPDAFWKVVILGAGKDERAIAWVVPNSKEATEKHLDDYLVSLGELEIITGEKIPVANYTKHDKPSASWNIPAGGCKSE
jgi:endonuclease G